MEDFTAGDPRDEISHFPSKGLLLPSTYLVYHEKGNEVLERLNDQLSELEGHEGCDGGKVFLDAPRGVEVALGSEVDPVLLLRREQLGTGGDPPAETGGIRVRTSAQLLSHSLLPAARRWRISR